jgi:hypothetical protein
VLAVAQRVACKRSVENAVIAAWLAVHIALPLSFYWGSDRSDERFAWRMFSAQKAKRCQVRASEVVAGAQQEIDLGSVVHVAWIATMERNRSSVIHHFLQKRCLQRGVASASLRRTCGGPGEASRLRSEYTISCSSGTISRSDEAP